MTPVFSDQTCQHLRVLLAATADDNPDAAAQTLTEHVALCPICAAVETSLTRLVGGYLRQEQAVPADLEQRLLDCLCGDTLR